MKKVLKLKFKDENDKTNFITISNPKEDLNADTIKVAMETMRQADIFAKEGVSTYAKVAGAYYYTTQEDDIFNVDEKAE